MKLQKCGLYQLYIIFLLLFCSCSKEFKYNKHEDAVKTLSVSQVSQTTATVSAKIVANYGNTIIARGICYSLKTNPDVSDLKKNDLNPSLGDFTCLLESLIPDTTYYVRAYATNSLGTAYGNEISFRTKVATVPILSSTTTASQVTANSASTGGIIAYSGASAITNRGVCWSITSSTPTISGSRTNDGSGTGQFVSILNGLIPNTTYYIRAYATNSQGTGYADVKTFKTTMATIPANISTSSISSISQTGGICGGNVGSDGGMSITARGVCWSNTTSTPTISNSKTVDGAGTGSFTSTLINLTPGVTYFVRAYATNGMGTAYGNTVSFTTQSLTIPTGISTLSITSVTQSSAVCGGSVTGDGGTVITARGVCWSNITSAPTTANTRTINGSGIGSFSSSLSGLLPGTTYYVRAYATNSAGTAYGNVVSFTTLPNLTIGMSYAGGKIAYIFVAGDAGYISGQTHGLIAATADQSTSAQWGCSGTTILGTSTVLGAGMSNTSQIVSNCVTTGIAAAICNNLVLGGYSDWYLPSRDELNKLYLNKNLIGGFSNTSYWSSSQGSSTVSWSINFNTGVSTSTTAKTTGLYVRAIRQF